MAPLVDYSSDSSESEADGGGPRAKRQKTERENSGNQTTTANPTTARSELPPLPSAFHDLYASTVRVSASDDPTLHQGRKRVNPHKVGHWPSHLYIEWHPTQSERSTLTTLLTNLQSTLSSSSSYISSSSSSPSSPPSITSFLTSDLGVPQPLHISLSRPIALTTPQKAPFTSSLESSIRSSGVLPFVLAPTGLEWHRTAESARSFLVLRVESASFDNDDDDDDERRKGEEGVGGSNEAKGHHHHQHQKTQTKNPQLTTLLNRFNKLVASHGQPALYTFPSTSTSTSTSSFAASTTINSSAFHISIAWSFVPPDPELHHLTSEVFNNSPTHDSKEQPNNNNNNNNNDNNKNNDKNIRDAVTAMRIRVDGVKAKVGNLVTHIPLPLPLPDASNSSNSSNSGRKGTCGLFGF